MRAVVMDRFGGPEVLTVRDVADPVPGRGQVLVAVEYAGITFVETQVRAGRGPALRNPPPLPRVPGNGVGGQVVAVGADVDPALAGVVVVTTTGGTGGYAELAVADADDLIPVPSTVPVRDAVALLADGRTAVLLHGQAEVKPAESVLVEAAGGGLGSLLVQLSAAAGATVIGAARGTAKRELVMSLGAAAYVDYSRPGWTLEVVEATRGTGVDLVYDGVGGDIGAHALTTLRAGGRISIHGMASGSWTEPPAGVTVISGDTPTPEQMRALAAEALAQAAAGRLRPIIGQTYPLGEAAAAHQAIEDRETAGKTLLVP
ncbi:Zn-dependent oxidoreductase, NADPH:quinone reductase [Frankia casuarinae]|uniref:Alcohol dehydrogenase, zinc-binding n=1 Tax=Frankia casuarinae (strain DSM 45818 / CECT 9043 / HFP020203 / CcI3) TaxID=106370 RepID=Q2J5E1_FRACC|nr:MULTISPECIES: zinc-binding dehydrogenase [Frankia]ABD13501.1 Alcohol dehydrogenase, zinc-binding [Frankia casuarinae]ESZ99786.1 Zn-dependent oxidoreductase, NADPH:quinone reductase [Frankia sp. CcI6]EYT89720.1 Zn-dependent oxidoreductase, NADPH:quinone reductase [Frankia casuarinae]KDA40492.1 Zn-dependent oxidoreductase, NADPH:quinone reductase [Frankia sp. BMG5.23]KFB02509.1 Zn-dependent oxidoreductase, NADPH:quinone reductase [Frankia sp. Allo2]